MIQCVWPYDNSGIACLQVTIELSTLLRSQGVLVSIMTFEESDGIAGLQDPFVRRPNTHLFS